MNYKFSKMTLYDLFYIKNILISDFDDFWNYNILKEELLCDNSHFIVVKNQHSEIIGFAGFKIIIDEADIMNIVIKKSSRNQGIGSLLLKNLIDYAKTLNIISLNLEVNYKNLSAINLYEKFNFKTLGIRKNYYNGIDDAIIMKAKIN